MSRPIYFLPLSSAPQKLTRREFTRHSLLAASLAAMTAPAWVRGQNLNSRINIACIGVGGKGSSDTDNAFKLGGNIVALCDVDETTLNGKHKTLTERATKENRTYDARLFRDFRKLLSELDKSIDAVTVSTPDHVHGVAALMAMHMGKHVYCQKPLTQTVWEAREMRRVAGEKKLATQMGNQGSAGDGLRRAVEVIQAGVIGHARELHVWSNRPQWPQGLARPEGEDPVPATLDWDLWLGPAPQRPYKKDTYHSFKWRGWYDYGTGALGDMACHTVNMPFRALKLGYPNVIECEMASRIFPETFPKTSRLRYEFPERDGLPPLKFWWYDGNPGDDLKPIRPPAEVMKEIVQMNKPFPGSGCVIVGDQGKIYSPDDYGSQFFVVLKDEKGYTPSTEHEACKAVPQSIPRSPGHEQEWFDMMKGGATAYSHFEIAAYLTEMILLGSIGLRIGVGRTLEWDGPNMRAKNAPDAAQFVKRSYRQGWAP